MGLQKNQFKKVILNIIKISLFLILGFWNSCSQNSPTKKQPDLESDPSIPLIKIKNGFIHSTMDIPGELIPYDRVDIYAKENSFVKKVKVDLGSEVKKGDLLAELEDPELISSLSSSKAKLQAQRSIWISSRYTYDKLLETSLTPGTVSPNDLQQALSKKNADSANFLSAISEVSEIEQRKKYLLIKAPFNGIITARNISAGAYVGPSGKGSDMPLFTLEEQKILRLAVSVPEDQTATLKKGEDIPFEIHSFPSKTFHARLQRLGGSLSNPLKSERLEMDVQNTNKILLPGMTAMVHIDIPSVKEELIIPKTAVMETSRGNFVVKIDKDNHLKYISVKRGIENKDLVAVYGDLQAGDLIVRSANEELREGTQINKSTLEDYFIKM